MIDEDESLEETYAQVRKAGSLGDLPLVVLTAAGLKWWPGWPPDFPAEQLMQRWKHMQQDLVKLSTNSIQIVAEESSHFIQFDQPEAVVNAVRQVIETITHHKYPG